MKLATNIPIICIIFVALCLGQCLYAPLSMAASKEYETYLKAQEAEYKRHASILEELEKIKQQVFVFKQRYNKFEQDWSKFQEIIRKSKIELNQQIKEQSKEQVKIQPKEQVKVQPEEQPQVQAEKILSQPEKEQAKPAAKVQKVEAKPVIKPSTNPAAERSIKDTKNSKPSGPSQKPIRPLNNLPMGMTQMVPNSFFLPTTAMKCICCG